jgi:hypothetical protein
MLLQKSTYDSRCDVGMIDLMRSDGDVGSSHGGGEVVESEKHVVDTIYSEVHVEQ